MSIPVLKNTGDQREVSVKILDFGLVLLNPWDEAAGELTTIGHFLGTLDYMAPEQAERSSSVDYRADLYSLGATLFRLLTGRPPLAATPNLSPLEKLRLLSDHTPPSLKTLCSDAPLELVKLVDSLLSTDPRQRPASAANAAEKLEPFAMEADLKTLISKGISHVEQLGDVEAKPRLTSYFDSNDQIRKSSGKWRWLIAASLVPLAMLAGMAITIATDQGTLRIESDDPDIQVSIHRVGKSDSKAELRVEQSGNDIRLASGEYEIRLTDTQANGFSLERDRVLITRGDKEIVRVSKEPKTVAESSLSAVLLYNGRTYEDWMQVLRADRRVSTLGQAIQAVVALASDSQQLEAAKASLLPARRYGSWSTIGLERGADKEDAFMSYYDDIFIKLDSNARLRAIVEEMEANHPRSDLACRRLIGNSNIRLQIATLNERPQERELWVRLKNQLLESIPQIGELMVGHANSVGTKFAISIVKELGESIQKEPKAIALVQSILESPESFRQNHFDGSGRNPWPVVPFGFIQLIAKLDRLPELPMPVLVSSLLGGGRYTSDEEINEVLSSISQDLRSQFFKSIRDHLKDGWEIFDNKAVADFLILNDNDRPTLAKLLREKVTLAENSSWGNGMISGHYLALAERLENSEELRELKPDSAIDKNSDAKFNRAGFEEWLNILKDERNPKLVCDAIQAVVTLAKIDDEALIAAKACLVAARTYGGFYFAEERSLSVQGTTPIEISEEFMNVFGKMYQMLAPLPAVQAIDMELQANHERSIEACKVLLYQMNRQVTDPRVLESKLGQEVLKSIATSFKRLTGDSKSNDLVQEYRIKLAYWTDESIENEPELMAYLAEIIERLKIEPVTFPFFPTLLYAAWESKMLEDIPVKQAAKALLGIDNADGFIHKLRDKDLIQLLGWYKNSPLFESFYEALLNEFITRPRVHSPIVEDFLVDHAPDRSTVRKTIQDAIDKLPKNGDSYENNGQTLYIYIDPVERAYQLEYLNRIKDRLN